jgi:CRISPR-associated protein Cas5d
MFNRRAASGQCFHQPCLGTREFPAEFTLVESEPPASELPPDQRNKDLGWMLYDIAFDNDRLPIFYRPEMIDGVIDVEKHRPAEARR